MNKFAKLPRHFPKFSDNSLTGRKLIPDFSLTNGNLAKCNMELKTNERHC